MNPIKDKVEYDTQPAFNQSFLPTAPPRYSDAVSSSSDCITHPGVMAYPGPPECKPDTNFTPSPPVVPQPSAAIVHITGVPQQPAFVAVGPNRVRVQCPCCRSYVLTKTSSSAQKSAHIACCILFFLGCCLCSCIPYCMKSCKNINHTCPICNSFIGTYRG